MVHVELLFSEFFGGESSQFLNEGADILPYGTFISQLQPLGTGPVIVAEFGRVRGYNYLVEKGFSRLKVYQLILDYR